MEGKTGLRDVALFKVALFAGSWFLVYFGVVIFARHSEAREAYGLISAWWCALYLCCLFDFRIKGSKYLLLAVIPWAFFMTWRSHDFDPSPLISFVGLMFNFGLVLFFLSPLLIHAGCGMSSGSEVHPWQ